MRRGYWTGFIMGGLLGMMAARAYGDRLLDTLFPGVTGRQSAGTDDDGEGDYLEPNRSKRRRRFRRSF